MSIVLLLLSVAVLLLLFVLAGLFWLLNLFLDVKLCDPIRNLRGLDASFFEPLYGVVNSSSPDRHNQWVQMFGHTFGFNGFGKFDYRLVTTDIMSLNHIITSSIYEKPQQTQKILSSFLGKGISLVEGAEHTRQRKVVDPAFSPSNVRRLYAPIFVDKAAQLCDAWNNIVDPQMPTKIDVLHWAGRATLDVIGLASFDHNFNAIEDENEEIYMAYRRMFDKVNNGPPFVYLLELQFPWIAIFWSSQFSKGIKESLRVIHRFGNMVINNKKLLVSYASEPFYDHDGKPAISDADLLSRLVDAGTGKPLSERLTNQELLDQVNTFLFAGSDTTALGIAWCLFFLSRNSSIQEILRTELLDASLDAGNYVSNIEALPLLDRVVKETLRLSPPVHSTIRVPTKDDVIPLSKPLMLRDGSTTSEVKIRKGTFVHIPLQGFNTCADVWGTDATIFDPARWLNMPVAENKHSGFAGLLTFLLGNHVCPGQKFALLEMKIFVARLISRFVFSPADEIDRANIILQRPYVKDKWELGPALPLNVKPYAPDP